MCKQLIVARETLNKALAAAQFDVAKFATRVAAESVVCNPEPAVPKRFRRDAFHKALLCTAEGLETSTLPAEGTALVFAGPSGVGKTYGTLAARQGFLEQDTEGRFTPVVAYLGFNCMAVLSDEERSFLSGSSAKAEEAIAVFMFSRLFAWLVAFKQVADPVELDMEGSPVQKQFEHPTLTSEELKGVQLASITEAVAGVLVELGQRHENLVLITVVDEGQKLEEFCLKGARLAVKCLRGLQSTTLKAGVRLLPVCTDR